LFLSDIDSQILHEMKMQTAALNKLVDVFTDIAATMKHFMNSDLVCMATINIITIKIFIFFFIIQFYHETLIFRHHMKTQRTKMKMNNIVKVTCITCESYLYC